MKKKNVALLYNPHAGMGIVKEFLSLIIETFQSKGYVVIPHVVEKPNQMVQFLKNVGLDSFDRILISGGDGTINLCVNALLQADIDIPIALFPHGTSNDFVHNFNIPNNTPGMIEVALQENYANCDVGLINDQYFINVASMGFLIDVSQKTDPNLKNALGMLSYYIKGIEELPKMKAIPIEVESQEYSAYENILFMLIMNGCSAGGFNKIAPKASVNDGKFDVIIFRECPVVDLMGMLIGVVRGDHVDNPYVKFYQTKEVLIRCGQQVGTDIDGEKGPDFPLHIKNISNRLKIFTK